jgi:hypothetical protein
MRYNVWWEPNVDPASMELDCIRAGGKWINKSSGQMAGNGPYYHFRRFQEIVWPEKIWENGPYKNYWAEKILEAWLEFKYLGIMGCASSGKSDSLASIALTDWYAFPDCTTTLVSSTEVKMLDLRIWRFIKKYHKSAKKSHDWIPGHLIEGKLTIIRDSKDEYVEGRDFLNAIIGCPAKKGNQYVGLGSFIGLHNKRVRLIADEAQLMPRGFLDSTSNLAMCEDFKLVAPGNPNETTNAHGVICEPSVEMGGWEGGIDQQPGTKIWKTRFPNGGCLQLPGNDSPNLKAPVGEDAPFSFLCTREHISEEASKWGNSDWHFDMFINAKMPRGQGSNRVITRQECERNGATLEPMWRDSNITKIASLDAAYRGQGGDRCVFTEINFGKEIDSNASLSSNSGIISQKSNVPQGRQILALIDQIVIPIESGPNSETPESQIVKFTRKQCENRGISPSNFFFDSGMKTSLVQEFSREWSLDVQSIDCGSPPTDQQVSMEINMPCHDYYKKLVTELWYSIRLIIISKQFRNLSTDVMWELCAREWTKTSGNKIELETKDDMRLKTGRSPDLADSLSLACWGARQRGFQIQRLQTANPPKRGRDWRDELRKKEKAIWSSGVLEFAQDS